MANQAERPSLNNSVEAVFDSVVAGMSAQQNSAFQVLTVPEAISEEVVYPDDCFTTPREETALFTASDKSTKTITNMADEDADDVYWKKLFFQNQKMMHDFMQAKILAETDSPLPNKKHKASFTAAVLNSYIIYSI
jgi:hypothetical protein